jgi:hypothetical protein
MGGGKLRVEDLTTLFLALRDRAGGRQSIVDVGDFVAHREERNKGYVTKAVRDFFVRIRFVIERNERPPSIYDLPPYIGEYLEAAARHMDYKAAKGARRFTRVNVTNALPALLSCVMTSAGRCYLWPSISDELIDLFNFLAGNLTFKPLFTENVLFDELCDALVENGLLKKGEIPNLLHIKGAVALFALTHMHQCFVKLGGEVKGYLEASAYGGGSNQIAVLATVPAMDSKGVRISHAIFLTDRTIAADCDANLAHLDPQNPVWTYPLELAPDKKLRRLGA